MHRFWGLNDPQAATMQQIQFLKNLSMLGGALIIAYVGAGPFSSDHIRSPKSRGAAKA
jgi:putative oxidoreductase